jgi:hypothetical protein
MACTRADCSFGNGLPAIRDAASQLKGSRHQLKGRRPIRSADFTLEWQLSTESAFLAWDRGSHGPSMVDAP